MKKMIHLTLMFLIAVMSFKADASFIPIPKKILKKEVIYLAPNTSSFMYIRIPA